MHTGDLAGKFQPVSTLPHSLPSHALDIPLAFRRRPWGSRFRSWLRARSPPVQSAPISGIRYEVTFDSRTAPARTLRVGMTFDVGGPGTVLLSLPAWTPGAYEISNFARWVSNFSATSGGKALTWDKLDYDTWRVRADGAKYVTVTFDYLADSLDNAIAWSRAELRVLQRHERLPLSRGSADGLHRDGHREDRTVVARDDRHEARGCAAHLLGVELPRPRRHAVLRRRVRRGQHADREQVGADGVVAEGRASGRESHDVLGSSEESDSRDGRGVQRHPVGQLHDVHRVRLDVGRRQRARASELTPRDLHAAARGEHPVPVDHGARDDPRVEREAAASRGHGAVPVLAAAADDVALGERGDHGLLLGRRALALRRDSTRRDFSSSRRARSRRRTPRRRSRSRTRRSRRGSIRPTAPATSTTRRDRSPDCCSTS